jgi:transposase
VSTPASTLRSETERIAELERQLAWAQLRIEALEAQLRLERIKKYGPASEKLSSAQLALLDEEPGVSSREVEAESQRPALADAAQSGSSAPTRQPPPEQNQRHPGRQSLPAHLPRVERVIRCAPEQCRCRGCGQPTAAIGYDTSEQLEVEPAQYFVRVTKREKRACAACRQEGVTTAPAPVRILDKGLVSDRVVIDTLVAKYSDHLPLYRQSAMLQREAGVAISRATMDGWVMRVGELLLPVSEQMRRELLAGSYLQADETTVEVQRHDGRGQNHQAYLWQYGQPGGSVVFDFQLGRGRDGPKQFLAGYNGLLQTDGYAAYEQVGGPAMVQAACWAHARRKFVDALKLNPEDRAAAEVVARLNELFAIDAEAPAQGLSPAERGALRQQRARPLVERIQQQVEAAQRQALPASAVGQAAKYTLALWPKLVRFLAYPELELSNNLAENAMRGVAVGRKNWIHIGSVPAGPKVAAILSVMESCRRLNLAVRDYLGAVLPGLADRAVTQLAGLTPAAWAAHSR